MGDDTTLGDNTTHTAIRAHRHPNSAMEELWRVSYSIVKMPPTARSRVFRMKMREQTVLLSPSAKGGSET